MNLADMLCYADIAELTAIAETYECTCSSHSKNELIQSILSTVQRRDVLESRVGEMTAADLRFLNSLLFESRVTYSLEELKARALGGESVNSPFNAGKPQAAAPVAPTPPAKGSRSRKGKNGPPSAPVAPEDIARHAISRFKKFGWLFNGFSQQTRYLYQVPEDVRTRLSDALEKRYRTMLDERDEPPAYRDEGTLLVGDMTQLLRFVRDNDLQITSEGVLYKRQIGQIIERLAVNETVPTRGGWRFGYGRHFRDYPDRMSFLYDYAYYHKLIEERTDRLTITEAGRDVADGTSRLEPPDLYRFWLRLYKGPIPNVTTLVQWITRLSAEWVSIESLYAILQPLVRSYYYDTSRDVFERRILTMLMHLGMIKWGETAGGEGVVRTTTQGKALVKGVSSPLEDKIILNP
ncbi:hypothetical protein [Cohnella yongneupensis]|uniref:Helicase XPB/Ssl2 N-terminal domain-containing protein n=1 Tax=Cohnella yongneupensis TaxID=425006 RepID=A0ABW0R5I0_9BACL